MSFQSNCATSNNGLKFIKLCEQWGALETDTPAGLDRVHKKPHCGNLIMFPLSRTLGAPSVCLFKFDFGQIFKDVFVNLQLQVEQVKRPINSKESKLQ